MLELALSALSLLDLLAELVRVLDLGQGLLQEIEIRLEHLEPSAGRLPDQLIVFASATELRRLDLGLSSHVSQHLELPFELFLLELVDTLRVVLVAEVVHGHLPSLKQVGGFLGHRLPVGWLVTRVDLQSPCNLTLL